MKLRHAITFALLAAPALAAAAPAPANDTMQVSLNLENRCTIDIDDIDFGVHNTLAANIDARSEMRIRCTGISSMLQIDFGPGGSGDTQNRRMSDGNGNTINYLFTTVQGSTWQATRHSFYGFGQNLTWPLYGRIYGGQNPKPAGSYSDTLVATVTF